MKSNKNSKRRKKHSTRTKHSTRKKRTSRKNQKGRGDSNVTGVQMVKRVKHSWDLSLYPISGEVPEKVYGVCPYLYSKSHTVWAKYSYSLPYGVTSYQDYYKCPTCNSTMWWKT